MWLKRSINPSNPHTEILLYSFLTIYLDDSITFCGCEMPLSRISGRDCSSTRCQKGSLHRLGTRKAGTLEQGLPADNESEEKGTKEPSPSAAQNCGEATVLVTRGSEPPSAAVPMLVSQCLCHKQQHQNSTSTS